MALLRVSAATVQEALGNRRRLPDGSTARLPASRGGAAATRALKDRLTSLVQEEGQSAQAVQLEIAEVQGERRRLARAVAATNAQADEAAFAGRVMQRLPPSASAVHLALQAEDPSRRDELPTLRDIDRAMAVARADPEHIIAPGFAERRAAGSSGRADETPASLLQALATNGWAGAGSSSGTGSKTGTGAWADGGSVGLDGLPADISELVIGASPEAVDMIRRALAGDVDAMQLDHQQQRQDEEEAATASATANAHLDDTAISEGGKASRGGPRGRPKSRRPPPPPARTRAPPNAPPTAVADTASI